VFALVVITQLPNHLITQFMSTLERAIAIAAAAHTDQVDKAGAPYILHPLRVMLRQTTLEAQIVAVLHDVVEDSDWTLDQLRAEGFAAEIIEAVEAVTRQAEESYEEFVLRAGRNSIGRLVKLADLADNLDLTRIAQPTAKDLARLERYRQAQRLLAQTEPGASPTNDP
jgi:(p)ppGpp synthase/HD superfamily hydrolase